MNDEIEKAAGSLKIDPSKLIRHDHREFRFKELVEFYAKSHGKIK
jgi:hypothetical protein